MYRILKKKKKNNWKYFYKIFEKEAKKFKNVKYLAQGTCIQMLLRASLLLEAKLQKIKSHHNVGGFQKK